MVEVRHINRSELTDQSMLGSGMFGTVYRFLYKKQYVAAKQLNKGSVQEEAALLQSLSHRNVIGFIGACFEENLLIMELAEESLYSYIHNPKKLLPFERICDWAQQIASGMHYLHCLAPVSIVHRDLKSLNVLVCHNATVLKLCDFGTARAFERETVMTFVGTVAWIAPEILRDAPVSLKCDVYSFGIVVWELIHRQVPFEGLNHMSISYSVLFRDERPHIPSSCPAVLATIMRECWHAEPQRRPSFETILTRFKNYSMDKAVGTAVREFIGQEKTWKNEILLSMERLREEQRAMTERETQLRQRQREIEEREAAVARREAKLAAARAQQTLPVSPSAGSHIGTSRSSSTSSVLTTTSTVNPSRDYNTGPVQTWTPFDVSMWVAHLQDPEALLYQDHFLENAINGKRLIKLQHEDLINMGVKSLEHREHLLTHIRRLNAEIEFPPLTALARGKSTTNCASNSSLAPVSPHPRPSFSVSAPISPVSPAIRSVAPPAESRDVRVTLTFGNYATESEGVQVIFVRYTASEPLGGVCPIKSVTFSMHPLRPLDTPHEFCVTSNPFEYLCEKGTLPGRVVSVMVVFDPELFKKKQSKRDVIVGKPEQDVFVELKLKQSKSLQF